MHGLHEYDHVLILNIPSKILVKDQNQLTYKKNKRLLDYSILAMSLGIILIVKISQQKNLIRYSGQMQQFVKFYQIELPFNLKNKCINNITLLMVVNRYLISKSTMFDTVMSLPYLALIVNV
jgi:hypothetical protein